MPEVWCHGKEMFSRDKERESVSMEHKTVCFFFFLAPSSFLSVCFKGMKKLYAKFTHGCCAVKAALSFT